jgi:hypothetical protein
LKVKHSKICSYTDDNSLSCKGDELEDIMLKLEEDAYTLLDYMISNGLVVNPNKTLFVLLSLKTKVLKELDNRETNITSRVAMDNIELANHTKLLRINIKISQGHEHFFGKGRLIK